MGFYKVNRSNERDVIFLGEGYAGCKAGGVQQHSTDRKTSCSIAMLTIETSLHAVEYLVSHQFVLQQHVFFRPRIPNANSI